MRTAETVLSIIRERSTRGLPLRDAYRQLYNPDLYLVAYGRLYRNRGALTPGVTRETVDGMSVERIRSIIDLLHREAYRWSPVRRIQIPKSKQPARMRPLGIPTWTDKLLQEAMRLILEAHYEPRFSSRSHGFRPAHGCHTALRESVHTWTGTKWFIEGDIKGCFDNIDHEVLLAILAETIPDPRFLRLIRQMLQAGYLEDWVYGKTLSGTPQGGVVSPILANAYLNKLDTFVEEALLPAYTRGTKRGVYEPYRLLSARVQAAQRREQWDQVRSLKRELRSLPFGDPTDPSYRRLRYVRYADDFLLGFVGPRSEAEEIKHLLGGFLRETLKLDLSQEKTVITHASTDAARFLGYELVVQQRDDYHPNKQRTVNGKVALRLPVSVIDDYVRRYRVNGHPKVDWFLANNSDFTVVAAYGAIYRGIAAYYSMAQNRHWLGRLHYYMRRSLLHTLAAKHRTSTTKLARRYTAKVETTGGLRTCLEVKVERDGGKPPLCARFGGIPLQRQEATYLDDRKPYLGPYAARGELVKRLLAQKCEVCGSREALEVHHIRRLADLNAKRGHPRPLWVEVMSARQRKSLVLCRPCHMAVQHGRMTHARRQLPDRHTN